MSGFKELQPVKAELKKVQPIKTTLAEQKVRDNKILKNFLK